MALGMSVLGYLLLACLLNLAGGQPVDIAENAFKVLTAEQLRDISLRQNPQLLELAVRTGERVQVDITAASQGVIVQEDVNTILNCLPWLMNFPGGRVRWLWHRYTNLDHTDLAPPVEQTREALEAELVPRTSITGDFDEVYTIIRSLIAADAEDSNRGIYECQVCIAEGITEFEVCHSANTTVATAGRPPIIDVGVGREPVQRLQNLDAYNIGSTICLQIDPVDPSFNIPLRIARLQCADVGQIPDENIPTPTPAATVTWEHIGLDGSRAFFAIDEDPGDLKLPTYMPPPEFVTEFPSLVGVASPVIVSTNNPEGSFLEFIVNNITRNASRPEYQALTMAFGFWTCTLNNSLGSQTETTFISDNCGQQVPSIDRDCTGIGEKIDGVYRLDSGSAPGVKAGCDVCVPSDSTLFLTISCPTNVNNFNTSVRGYRWTDDDGNVLSVAEFVSVNKPGNYTCTVTFDDGTDSATSRVSFAPDVELRATVFSDKPLGTLGCERLRFPDPRVEPGDICVLFALNDDSTHTILESLDVECISEGFEVDPIYMPSSFNGSAITGVDDETMVQCVVMNDIPSEFDPRCAVSEKKTIFTYAPPKIIVKMEPDMCPRWAGITIGSFTILSTDHGTTVRVCCLVARTDDATVEWFRVVRGPNGIPREVPISNLTSDYSFTNELIGFEMFMSHTLLIANYDPERDDGTFVCRTENIVGTDVGSVALNSDPITYRWAASEWCDCEPFCLNGTRSRKVWCEESPSGIVRPDCLCDCTMRLSEVEDCFNVPGLDMCYLTPLWRTGEFSKCSKGCAGGVRYREVTCALPLDGSTVPDQECLDLYGHLSKPPSYDICFNTCCITDSYPEYCRNTGIGPCDNPIYQQHCCWTCGLSVQG